MRALKRRNIDLYKAYQESLATKKQQTPLVRALILPCSILILSVTVFAGTFIIRQIELRNAAPVMGYIEDTEIKAQYDAAKKLADQRDKMILKSNSIDAIDTALGALPKMDDVLLKAILEYAGPDVMIRELDYDAQTKTLNIAAQCTTPEQGTIFAEGMRGNSIFENMSYHGYEVQTDGTYEMTVSALVKASEVAK